MQGSGLTNGDLTWRLPGAVNDGHNSDDRTTSRQSGNALEPEQLSPRNMGQARLLVRGAPAQMVELIDWTDFVKCLDELREVRRPPL